MTRLRRRIAAWILPALRLTDLPGCTSDTGRHDWQSWSVRELDGVLVFGVPVALQRRRCLTCGLTQEASITVQQHVAAMEIGDRR